MKRILWKRGMRLTDDILRSSDSSTAEFISQALILAAAGRFGLFPSPRHPFEMTLDIAGNVVDVVSLTCLAITKGGHLIDVNYDTRYTNNNDTRVLIPDVPDQKEFILTVNALPEEWRDTNDGFEAPVYTFSLFAPDTPVPDYAVPIARIVDDHGWRMDETDFVPPCLFVNSHPKYEELLQRFSEVLASIDTKTRSALETGSVGAIHIFWPIIQQLRISVSKECDLLTPMTLLSNVQKCVSAFTCACDLDESLELTDAKMFRSYVLAPYNYQDVYQRIKVGLEICFSIVEKVSRFQGQPKKLVKETVNTSLQAPYINENQLFQNCRSQEVSIPVVCPNPKAKVYFSIDGSEPARTLSQYKNILVNNGFNRKRVEEMDQILNIKLKAVLDGVESEVKTFTVTLHKDYRSWLGPII